MNIAFIGLGNMGAPMARNLIKAGHLLNLFDLNQDILSELAAQGGHISASPKAAAQGAQLVLHPGHLLIHPRLLRTKGGGAYRVFTPFIEGLARRRGFHPDTPPHLRKVTETV